MTYVGIPQGCESVALKLVNAAAHLRAHGQAIVRPDLDLKSTIRCQQELLAMLEPKKAKGTK